MLEVGQNLHDLAQVLRVQPLDEGLADNVGKKPIEGLGSELDRHQIGLSTLGGAHCTFLSVSSTILG